MRALQPMVKSWPALGLATVHDCWSSLPALLKRHVPAWFVGARGTLVLLPVKVKSWELVTDPPVDLY
jgi:hypothetical protein